MKIHISFNKFALRHYRLYRRKPRKGNISNHLHHNPNQYQNKDYHLNESSCLNKPGDVQLLERMNKVYPLDCERV